ncbi:MAG TPA: T9SS type A sorting domain-containing protein [Ignavibacteriaceae bacterium]|nr:T9SS type A sorting domain-containing protein [Ignavibacteriaceae bacterium]
MKRFLQLFTLILMLGMSFNFAQTGTWKYTGDIKFPASDSGLVQPYLCATDVNGRLYVASSRANNASAHNTIYYADSTDTVFTKMIDFTAIGDTVYVSAIRGLAAIGTDVFVSFNQNLQQVGNTVATIYRYKNGNVDNVEKWGFGMQGAGYGTHIHGMSITRDTILYTGVVFGTSIRLYNFNSNISSPAYGSWVPMNGTAPIEPGGPHDAAGYDIIRDAAVIPNGDYTNPETPFYTSRNSSGVNPSSGGIAVWTGGDQNNPVNYTAVRVQDAFGTLNLTTFFPYGITVDNSGKLWIAGTDTLKKWVKAFEVQAGLATEVVELPSLNSTSVPDPNGAPLQGPSDVTLSPSMLNAYVTDGVTKGVYKFTFEIPNANNEEIKEFNYSLEQNYPNPFNPSTVIAYTLPASGNVKLTVTNALGQQVGELVNGYMEAGKHTSLFNANNLPSGIYFYTLTTDFGSFSKKMMLIK